MRPVTPAVAVLLVFIVILAVGGWVIWNPVALVLLVLLLFLFL